MKTTPQPSELDIYINSIVDKLRDKYGYSDRSRMRSTVRFYAIGLEPQSKFIEIPYTELKECMEKNILPTEIQKIL